MGDEINKVHKIEGLWSAQERRQQFSAEDFKKEYFDCWVNKDEKRKEEVNRIKLLEFIENLSMNDIYVRRIIDMLCSKYHDEIVEGNSKYLKYGWIQYMFENHHFEFMYEIMKVMNMKSNNLEQQLMDTLKSVPSRFVCWDGKNYEQK